MNQHVIILMGIFAPVVLLPTLPRLHVIREREAEGQLISIVYYLQVLVFRPRDLHGFGQHSVVLFSFVQIDQFVLQISRACIDQGTGFEKMGGLDQGEVRFDKEIHHEKALEDDDQVDPAEHECD